MVTQHSPGMAAARENFTPLRPAAAAVEPAPVAMLRLLFLLPLLALTAPAQDTAEADKRIVQTVQRLASFDYQKASVKTKEAIDRHLAATAGSEEYFQLVEKFSLISQKDTLLKLAVEKAGTPPAGRR